MFELFDIWFVRNAGQLGLNQATILVTNEGYWLYAFDPRWQEVIGKLYKTLKGAKTGFYLLWIRGKNGKEAKKPDWFSIQKESQKRWPERAWLLENKKRE